MRVVQVANFYGPRSGGLRTAVDRLGAEYCAAGHEVFLIVPGQQPDWVELQSGVTRISLPAKHDSVHRRLPCRVASAGDDAARRPGAGRHRGVRSTHAAIARQLGPAARCRHRDDLARTAGSSCRTDTSASRRPQHRGFRQPPDRRELRRGGVHDGIRPCGVRPDPRTECADRAARRGSRSVSPAPTFGTDAATVGAPRTDAPGALRPSVGGEACAPEHRHRWRAASFGCGRATRGGGRGTDAGAAGAPGRPVAGRLHRLHRLPRHGGDDPGVCRCGAGAGPSRDLRTCRAGGAGLRHARRRVADVSARRDTHHGQRRDGGQRSASRSHTPCRRSSADRKHCGAPTHVGAPSNSRGRALRQACSGRWARCRRSPGRGATFARWWVLRAARWIPSGRGPCGSRCC